MYHVAYLYWLSPSDTMQHGYGHYDMSAFTHPTEDRCIATGDDIDYEINVSFDENYLNDADAIGRWDNRTNTVYLTKKTDVDTIAHEVSHLVDDFLKQDNLTDPHYRAYAQGYWTQCVYEIVNQQK